MLETLPEYTRIDSWIIITAIIVGASLLWINVFVRSRSKDSRDNKPILIVGTALIILSFITLIADSSASWDSFHKTREVIKSNFLKVYDVPEDAKFNIYNEKDASVSFEKDKTLYKMEIRIEDDRKTPYILKDASIDDNFIKSIERK